MKIIVKTVNKKVKIKDIFDGVGIPNEEHASKAPPINLRVKTPYGYKRIANMFRTERQKTVTTYFGNNKTLKTSDNHRIKSNGDWVYVKDLRVGQKVETLSDNTKVIKKITGREEILYDISVEDVHCYYSNGILSHNSWCLNKVGVEALKQGKNVVHFTMELQQKYVGRRYDCCFTGVDFQNIVSHKEQVYQELKNINSWLKIKYFPIKTVSALSLKNYIERIQMLSGEKVDLMIVDYADILKPVAAERNSNSYSEAGGIYEELRGVAGELQIPCWTASQTNRGSASEDVIEAGSISDSFRKIMTADFVMSISRKTEDKLQNTARAHVIKNRFGADGCTFNSFFDASCGNINIYDRNDPESAKLQSKMSDGENAAKRRVQDIWNNTKDDSSDGLDLG